jgi:hypothetical protein
MASAVPDSCCKSYEPKCAQKPYGKHPSNIFYEVLEKLKSIVSFDWDLIHMWFSDWVITP